MSTDKVGNVNVWHCDSCAEHYEGEPGEDFAASWAAAKEDGWRAWRVGKEWCHACPACAEKEE